MELFLIGLDGMDRLYMISAIIGGALFVIRILLAFVGHHGDIGGGGDIGGHGDFGAGHDGSSSADFHLLSLQSLTGFFLMFGMSGLALHRGVHTGAGVSLLGALLVGCGTVLVMAKLAQLMLGLQSSGTLDLKRAVGHTGLVYLGIHGESGVGKVQVEIANRLLTLDAMAQDRGAIKTGERVEVVEVINEMLVVRRI